MTIYTKHRNDSQWATVAMPLNCALAYIKWARAHKLLAYGVQS